jgi:hypothetical protein
VKKQTGSKILTRTVFGLCIAFIAVILFISVLYAIEIFKNAGAGII